MFAGWRNRRRARRAFAHGQQALDARQLDDAATDYLEVLRLVPNHEPAWFNLGLVRKWQRRWRDSLECCQRAVALTPDNPPAWWNLGIAATALGEWDQAREAWRRYGIDVPEGSGPPDLGLGPVPIRIDPEGDAEVVWCRRVDPARAVIESVPLPESGRRWADVLLHDGEPVGHRMLGPREVAVFNEIEVLERSAHETAVVTVKAPGSSDVESLLQAFAAEGLAAEDWTSNIRVLCRECSEGSPHEHDPSDEVRRGRTWDEARRMGIAAPDPHQVERLLDRWAEGHAGRSRGDVEFHRRADRLH